MTKQKGTKESSRIIIGHGYEIQVDTMAYSLVYNTGMKSKDGKPVYRHLSHHGSLEKALVACTKEFVRKDLVTAGTLSLDEAVSIIVRSNNRFQNYIKSCFKGVTT